MMISSIKNSDNQFDHQIKSFYISALNKFYCSAAENILKNCFTTHKQVNSLSAHIKLNAFEGFNVNSRHATSDLSTQRVL